MAEAPEAVEVVSYFPTMHEGFAMVDLTIRIGNRVFEVTSVDGHDETDALFNAAGQIFRRANPSMPNCRLVHSEAYYRTNGTPTGEVEVHMRCQGKDQHFFNGKATADRFITAWRDAMVSCLQSAAST